MTRKRFIELNILNSFNKNTVSMTKIIDKCKNRQKSVQTMTPLPNTIKSSQKNNKEKKKSSTQCNGVTNDDCKSFN